ncbi:MAG TPA: reverse transcriptase family protein [Humisphaera sp.]
MSPTPGVPAGPAQRPVASPVMAGQAQPSSGARRPGRAPPPAESTDLDLGPFAPLAGADLKDAAGKLKDDWRSRWLFGRSHRIPPTADPRTNLIDRAMVAQGLLSPEELAEIHRVGDEWDRLRPDLQVELAKAELALPDTEQERLARKAQKRAEAAERRRLRAEQVAQRRATDIVYLGRGVSSRLHDRGSDVAKLEAAGLPVLSTPADVAAALGLSVPRLRWLAFHADAATVSHYVRFEVLKRSGGTRQLAAPHKHLATAQQWVLANVLTKVPTHPAAHGFVPGRSTVTNAAAHVGRRLVVNADLSDFFPSITFPRVRGVFRQLGYSPAVATVLALLCTECPRRTVTYAGRPFHVATGPRGLPQGACTSPALSNLAARRFDSRLNGIASKLGWTFTRYADDLTFSSAAGDEAERKVGYLLARVRHIADDEGFAVNEKKTRVLRPSAAQTVTGIVVNERLGVSRDTVRRLRAILHRAKAEGLAAQNRENHPHYEAWVRGMVAYVHMVNPQQAAPLRAALDAL